MQLRVLSTTALLVVSGLPFARPAMAQDIPANGWVVWASNRQDSRHELYLAKADGTGITRLTFSGGKFPAWSPDGKWIAYNHLDGSTHVIRHTGSGDKKVCAGEFEFWLWDKSGLVCGSADSHYKVNPDTGAQTLLFQKSDFSKLGSKTLHPGGITADGRYLVGGSDIYRTGYSGSNGSFTAYHAAVVLDLQDKTKLYYFGSGCEPTTPPSGNLIFHVCGDCPTKPDPYRMSTLDLLTRSSYQAEIAHPDADWGHEYFPRISNDGIWLTYGATTDGCHDHDTCDYEIFIHRLGAGSSNRTRVTNHTKNDQWAHLWVGTLPVIGCTSPAECDDKAPCTSDTCSAGKCVHTPVSGCCTSPAQCDDKNACSTDTCTSNLCQHVAVKGCCGQDADCADSNVCTTDTCQISAGTCTNAPKAGCCAFDTDCDDKDVCTADSCDTGTHTCKAVKKEGCCTGDSGCDDGDACTTDSCDVAQHACQHSPICDSGLQTSDGGQTKVDGSDGGQTTETAQTAQAARRSAALTGGCTAAAGGDPPRSPFPLLLLLAAAAMARRRRPGQRRSLRPGRRKG